jgi:ribose transport system ATP-binding protein
MRSVARHVLARLGHSEIDPDASVSTLSVAEQQLVEIGRALAVGCRVLVLDEPTSSLGRDDVRCLFELIRQLKSEQHAIVYISHFLEEVKEIADRIVVLRDGRVAGESAAADIDAPEIVRLMVGRGVEDLFPRSPRNPGEIVLRVENFGPTGATIELRRGEILGIAGLLGSGRTSLLRALFATSGGWRRGIGFVSEDRKSEGLAMSLDIASNLTLSKLSGLGPAGLVMPRRQQAAAETWMSRLAIRAHGAWQRVAELSGGNQQKVAIGRLLHHDVDVLLLDEPTRGIDVGSKAQIYALLDALVTSQPPAAPKRQGREGGRAIVLVSSYFPELLGLCDRIAVMHRGRLGPARPASEWTEHTLILAATGANQAA